MKPLLEVGPGFDADFGRRPFLLAHRLAQHPAFALTRLVELAGTLPAASVEYNAGDLAVNVDPAKTPRNGLSPEETIRRIQTCRSWLVLKLVEQDREYAGLLDRCLAALPVPVRSERHAFIFVSSPGAVTPFHMDPEENFLLQIRGRKTMHLFERSVIAEPDVERFFTGAHRNLVLRDEYRQSARSFELVPGCAVHVPVAAPHWVKNGPEVSISFSITFQTPDSKRRAHAHRMNARLRRLGLQPAAVGASPLRDRLKQVCNRIISRAA